VFLDSPFQNRNFHNTHSGSYLCKKKRVLNCSSQNVFFNSWIVHSRILKVVFWIYFSRKPPEQVGRTTFKNLKNEFWIGCTQSFLNGYLEKVFQNDQSGTLHFFHTSFKSDFFLFFLSLYLFCNPGGWNLFSNFCVNKLLQNFDE